jgi:hypothetical protein
MRVSARTILVVLSCLIIAVPASACGGGDNGGGASPTSTSSEAPTSTTALTPGYLVVVPNSADAGLMNCAHISLSYTVKNTGGEPITWVIHEWYTNLTQGQNAANPLSDQLHASPAGGTIGGGQSVTVAVTGDSYLPDYTLTFQPAGEQEGVFGTQGGYETQNVCQQ